MTTVHVQPLEVAKRVRDAAAGLGAHKELSALNEEKLTYAFRGYRLTLNQSLAVTAMIPFVPAAWSIWAPFQSVSSFKAPIDGCTVGGVAMDLDYCVSCNGNSTTRNIVPPESLSLPVYVFVVVSILLLQVLVMMTITTRNQILECASRGVYVKSAKWRTALVTLCASVSSMFTAVIIAAEIARVQVKESIKLPGCDALATFGPENVVFGEVARNNSDMLKKVAVAVGPMMYTIYSLLDVLGDPFGVIGASEMLKRPRIAHMYSSKLRHVVTAKELYDVYDRIRKAASAKKLGKLNESMLLLASCIHVVSTGTAKPIREAKELVEDADTVVTPLPQPAAGDHPSDAELAAASTLLALLDTPPVPAS